VSKLTKHRLGFLCLIVTLVSLAIGAVVHRNANLAMALLLLSSIAFIGMLLFTNIEL